MQLPKERRYWFFCFYSLHEGSPKWNLCIFSRACVLLFIYVHVRACMCPAIREAEDSNAFITKLRAKTEQNRAVNEQTVTLSRNLLLIQRCQQVYTPIVLCFTSCCWLCLFLRLCLGGHEIVRKQPIRRIWPILQILAGKKHIETVDKLPFQFQFCFNSFISAILKCFIANSSLVVSIYLNTVPARTHQFHEYLGVSYTKVRLIFQVRKFDGTYELMTYDMYNQKEKLGEVKNRKYIIDIVSAIEKNFHVSWQTLLSLMCILSVFFWNIFLSFIICVLIHSICPSLVLQRLFVVLILPER